MSTAPIKNSSNNLQSAITAGNGFSESTVDGQLIKAIANLTAHIAVDSVEGAEITVAIALLTAQKAHSLDPKNKG